MAEEKTYPWWIAAGMMADGKFMKMESFVLIHRINLDTKRLQYWDEFNKIWVDSNIGSSEQPNRWVVCDGPAPHSYVPCSWAEAYTLRECSHNYNEAEHYTHPALKCNGTGYSIKWSGGTLFKHCKFEMRSDLYSKFFAK